nr:hypothetical protein [Clostridia bacterium]
MAKQQKVKMLFEITLSQKKALLKKANAMNVSMSWYLRHLIDKDIKGE